MIKFIRKTILQVKATVFFTSQHMHYLVLSELAVAQCYLELAFAWVGLALQRYLGLADHTLQRYLGLADYTLQRYLGLADYTLQHYPGLADYTLQHYFDIERLVGETFVPFAVVEAFVPFVSVVVVAQQIVYFVS